MKKGRGKKYIYLLEEKEVKRWYDNVSRGSIITADVYLRRLGNFCENKNISPMEFASKSEKELYGIFLDYVSELEDKGRAGSYIECITKALKSWISHNDKNIKKIKIRNIRATPTLKDEGAMTPEDLKKILLSGNKKCRIASVLIAHAGLRPETLGSYMGTDGLRIKDLPELKIEGKTVEFENIPTMVKVRQELSKANHEYSTFLSEEGCEYLKDYLEERLRNGEEITNESAIINPKTAKKNFISTTNISDIIRKAIRKAGFSCRPYALRTFFATQLLLAESKGLSVRDYRTYWMGHKGDIEHVYTTNRAKQPVQVIGDMREAYTKCQEFLQTTTSPSKKEDIKKIILEGLLHTAGFTDEEIEKECLLDKEEKETNELIKNRIFGTKNNNKQKVISEKEIEAYLNDGWIFVANTNGSKVIVQRPS